MKKHIAEELPARQFKQADMDASKEGGKDGKEEKGGKSPEDRIKQAVYDIRYRARREELPLQQAFSQYMQNSSMGNTERMAVKKKLFGEKISEDFQIEEIASDSIANALYKVFVENKNEVVNEEELLNYYREEVITNAKGEKKYKVEVIGKDGRSYVRYATREKINDLRTNPNIKSVEMTDYGQPYEGERKSGSITAKAKAGKDWDGDGKIESGSKEHAGAVHNAIQRKTGGVPDGKDTRKEEVEFIGEVKKVKKNKKDDGKIDVMKGKNIVKVGPSDGQNQNIMAGYEYDDTVITESEISSGQLKFIKMLQEKAVSQNQQQLAGMALAYLRGDMPDASEEVKKMAKMGEKKLRDFAKTKHEGLPEKVEEAKCDSSDKNENGEDERGDYAKKNLIKNRIRAALGVKNPIVISASNEMGGEQIDEFWGPKTTNVPSGKGGKVTVGKNYPALKNGEIVNVRYGEKGERSVVPAKSSIPVPKPVPAPAGKPAPQPKRPTVTQSLEGSKGRMDMWKNSYEPEGDMVDEGRRGGEFRSLGRADKNDGRNRYMGSPTPEQEAEEKRRGDEAAERAKAKLRRSLGR
jgi:hypothetical protein